MVQSQAQLEALLPRRWEQVESGQLSHFEAFGNLADWTLPLGDQKAFLHPEWRQWLWYDRLHGEWVFTECGLGEGILVVIGKLGGVKKLPFFDHVENWCILLQQEELLGPFKLEEAAQQFARHELPVGTSLWTPLRTEWLPATQTLFEQLLEERTLFHLSP